LYISTSSALHSFPMNLFGSTTLLTGMTSISLQMQWPLTSQSHGSVSQREQLVFHYGSNSTPRRRTFLGCQIRYFFTVLNLQCRLLWTRLRCALRSVTGFPHRGHALTVRVFFHLEWMNELTIYLINYSRPRLSKAYVTWVRVAGFLLVQHIKPGKNRPNSHKTYQMSLKYTEYP
jgi:hypothetical protein